MSIKWTTKKNLIPSIMTEMKEINGKKIEVGVLEGEHQWLAGIHEYGCDIKARNVRYLTVPINANAAGKRAREFNDLFVLTSRNGNKFLARKAGRNNETELLYWLTEKVTIPERSFLRAGHDDVIKDVMKYNDNLLKQVTTGRMSARQYLDAVGQQLSAQIKRFTRDLDNPPNTSATKNVKGSSNPLVDTGDMIEGITWRIED